MKRLHVASDRNPCNGIYVAAELMAAHDEDARLVTCGEFLAMNDAELVQTEEIVVHGCWLPCYWKSCWRALKLGKRLVRMTHANLDPVRLAYHGWKKRLVSPIERYLFRRCDRILATCEAEAQWNRDYLGANGRWEGRGCAKGDKIEIVDLKRFFKLNADVDHAELSHDSLHVLFLGRPHPLKGIRYLEQAVAELKTGISLRIVSDHHGEELEKDWTWCDVLCLPTLTENFGLVVAEALERGKRVITTDGAPAWEEWGKGEKEEVKGFVYLRGYRDGSDGGRVELLKAALRAMGAGGGGILI